LKERKKEERKKKEIKNTDQYHSNFKIFAYKNISQKIIQRLNKNNNIKEYNQHYHI
jgi:hypothetical protein